MLSRKEMVSIFQLLGIIISVFCISSTSSNQSCPKPKQGMTNVHLVCHTHDDVGWLKTVDQYYYGSNKTITWVGVQYILDSIMPSLLRDPSRKFIFVESAFFFRWWNEQSEDMKATVQKFVREGQLEFINGGWCMNDEAAAHYSAIIDQMTFGLMYINDTFGSEAAPTVAWQIDPFGHSREQASLFAQMGFDGLFFGRLDYDDKKNRWKKKELEMIWKGSSSLGSAESWLFTGVLPNGYSPPQGFCFDLLCADDPIMDDPRLEDYNKESMVDLFIAAAKEQRKGYATSNIMMTMGEDFNYVYAESWFKNLDKLMMYVNERQNNGSTINVMYSTPSCYLQALHNADMKWSTKSDDFFPYASDPHAFWTGYFTSRPTLKGFIRQSNNILQASKQIAALSGIGRTSSLDKLAAAMAVAQHHDAVSGTAKQHVTNDYAKRLSIGITAAYDLVRDGFRKLYPSFHMDQDSSFNYCPLLNISCCPFTEKSRAFLVSVYNPIARPISIYIRIPVSKNLNYVVVDPQGNTVPSQIVPLPLSLKNIPGRVSIANYDLVFYAENLPSLGFTEFLIQSHNVGYRIRNPVRYVRSTEDAIIKKGKLAVKLDSKTKMLKSVLVQTKKETKEIQVKQELLMYNGMAGNDSKIEFRASGAYIFRPNGTAYQIASKIKNTAIYDGPLVAEVHQEWCDWATQVLRLYKEKAHIEIEWLVGPIPVKDGIGKEIVNRITWLEMKTNKTFYTDANGRELMKRIKDKRETWILNSTEPVSQNYYPVTSRLILSTPNNEDQSALLNDRSQGGTSLSDGEMELMVHRRLLYDDTFGVGEPLNEEAFETGLVARGKHYLIHSSFGSDDCHFACQHRTLAEEVLLQPIITLSSAPPNPYSWMSRKIPKKSGLTKPLPANIHLLTLEPWKHNRWLLRLENFYEKGELLPSDKPEVTIDLADLFTDWTVTGAEEVSLAANRFKKDIKRLKWKARSEDEVDRPKWKARSEDEVDRLKWKADGSENEEVDRLKWKARSEDEEVDRLKWRARSEDEEVDRLKWRARSEDEEVDRLKWRARSEDEEVDRLERSERGHEDDSLTFIFLPMQIRSFIISIERKH